MTPFAPRVRLLIALFDLAQADETIDLFLLAEVAGLNVYRTLAELEELAQSGLADARRLRLTTAGLALTVGILARFRSSVGATVTRIERPDGTPRAQKLNPSRQQAEGAVGELIQRDLVA